MLGLTVVLPWLTAEYLELIFHPILFGYLLFFPHQMHLQIEKIISITVFLVNEKLNPDFMIYFFLLLYWFRIKFFFDLCWTLKLLIIHVWTWIVVIWSLTTLFLTVVFDDLFTDSKHRSFYQSYASTAFRRWFNWLGASNCLCFSLNSICT